MCSDPSWGRGRRGCIGQEQKHSTALCCWLWKEGMRGASIGARRCCVSESILFHLYTFSPCSSFFSLFVVVIFMEFFRMQHSAKFGREVPNRCCQAQPPGWGAQVAWEGCLPINNQIASFSLGCGFRVTCLSQLALWCATSSVFLITVLAVYLLWSFWSYLLWGGMWCHL